MPEANDPIIPVLNQVQASDFATAVSILQAFSDAHPQDPRPLLLLAGTYATAQDMDRAEASYISALALAPDFAIARFQLGLLQFTSGRSAVAFTTWAPLRGLEASHPLRLFSEAFGAIARDDFKEALLLLREGMAQNVDNPPLNEDMARLIERLRQAGLVVPADAAPGEQNHPMEDKPEPSSDSHFLLSAYKIPPSGA